MIDPANASELAQIAHEVGADVFQGALRYPSGTGGCLVGDLDFCEYLDRYRNQQVMVILASLGQAPTSSYTCGICGFVYNERGECPRCRLASEQGLLALPGGDEGQDLLINIAIFESMWSWIAKSWREMAMNPHIRAFATRDVEALVQISLAAWVPVFSSFERILGPEIYPRLYPDWRQKQREGVEFTCNNTATVKVLVAELDETVVGFLAYELKDEIGEVLLLAVHPEYQNQGIGTELNMVALQQMKAAGMEVAEVGTGGDEGHAPARRSYEKAGYTALPTVRYYKAL